VTLSAAVNSARTATFTSNVFKLGSPASVAATRKTGGGSGRSHSHHRKPKKHH
jgi:hypothetical protein